MTTREMRCVRVEELEPSGRSGPSKQLSTILGRAVRPLGIWQNVLSPFWAQGSGGRRRGNRRSPVCKKWGRWSTPKL